MHIKVKIITHRRILCILLLANALSKPSKAQEFSRPDFFEGHGGLGLGISGYTSLKSNWLSIDVEILQTHPIAFRKYYVKEKPKRNILLNGGSQAIGQIGAEYNFDKQSMGIRFGLYQHISILSFNPVQIIYTFGDKYKGLTYRPEVGIGYWIFQLNYAYNLNFNKELNNTGNHLLQFKIHLIVFD